MAINRSSISSSDITEVTKVAIEMVATQPTGGYQDLAGTPNVLVGYYDSTLDQVELYVRDSTGRRLLKVV